MSKVLRSEVEEAVERILGKDVYEALCRSQVSLPRVMDMAVSKCFVQQMTGPAVHILREGMKILESTGELTNDEA